MSENNAKRGDMTWCVFWNKNKPKAGRKKNNKFPQNCAGCWQQLSRSTWRRSPSTSLWMKKRRSAALHAGEDRRRVVRQEGAGTYISTSAREENLAGPLDNPSGQREVVALILFPFCPPSLWTLWLIIFYITMTRPELGTDSLAKALCDRKTCTKLKTTNLSRVFSSSQRSAATARILYGEHPRSVYPVIHF